MVDVRFYGEVLPVGSGVEIDNPNPEHMEDLLLTLLRRGFKGYWSCRGCPI